MTLELKKEFQEVSITLKIKRLQVKKRTYLFFYVKSILETH